MHEEDLDTQPHPIHTSLEQEFQINLFECFQISNMSFKIYTFQPAKYTNLQSIVLSKKMRTLINSFFFNTPQSLPSPQMNSMSLKQHLKVLKVAIPVKQRESQHNPQLLIFKRLKQMTKIKESSISNGIFSQLSFCVPLLDPTNDPPNDKATQLLKGIFMQGGEIIEFTQDMAEKMVKYIIISEKSDPKGIRQKLAGLVKFEMILDYNFIIDSLKRLKRMKPENYLLFDNSIHVHQELSSAELAKAKLESEHLNEKLIRPRLASQEEEPHPKYTKTPNQLTNQSHPQENKGQTAKTGGQENAYEQFCQKGIQEIEDFFDQLSEISQENQFLSSKIVMPSPTNQPMMALLQQRQTQNLNKQEETTRTAEKKFQIIQENKRAFEQDASNLPEQNSTLPKKSLKRQKSKQEQKYKRNELFKQQLKQKPENKPKEQIQQPYFPWQPKGDRKMIWYAPPKSLASHSFKKNDFICEKLMQLQQIYKRNGDIRNFPYIRAVGVIKSHNKEIKTPDDLRELQGLTPSMIEKIKQILETGQLTKLNRFQRKEQVNVCKELQRVWGIGCKKAMEFYNMGIKTVQDLRKRPDLISKNVSVGLKYFEQFSQRIPREKVTRIFQEFKKIYLSQVLSQKIHHVEVVGSYRRGKATCGDIDILICRHDGSVEPKLLINLIRELQDRKFITQSLSQPRLFDGRNNSAYMGVCLFEGKHHRIDIKHYPVEQYAFALMYFTGSDLFNRQMRMVAHNKGLLLSDHGLKPKERNGLKKIWKGGEIPILRTEQDIFKFLQTGYCSPAEREI